MRRVAVNSVSVLVLICFSLFFFANVAQASSVHVEEQTCTWQNVQEADDYAPTGQVGTVDLFRDGCGDIYATVYNGTNSTAYLDIYSGSNVVYSTTGGQGLTTSPTFSGYGGVPITVCMTVWVVYDSSHHTGPFSACTSTDSGS